MRRFLRLSDAVIPPLGGGSCFGYTEPLRNSFLDFDWYDGGWATLSKKILRWDIFYSSSPFSYFIEVALKSERDLRWLSLCSR